jgi:hypothetical protein
LAYILRETAAGRAATGCPNTSSVLADARGDKWEIENRVGSDNPSIPLNSNGRAVAVAPGDEPLSDYL